jgi:hypothetical protein
MLEDQDNKVVKKAKKVGKGKLNEKQQALKVLSKIKFTNVSDLISKHLITLRTAIKADAQLVKLALN